MKQRIRAHFSDMTTLFDRLAPLLSDRKLKVGNVTVTCGGKTGQTVATIEADTSGSEKDLGRLCTGRLMGDPFDEVAGDDTEEKELVVIWVAPGKITTNECKTFIHDFHVSLQDDGCNGMLVTAENRPDRIDALIGRLFSYGIISMSRTKVSGGGDCARRPERLALAADGDGSLGSRAI